MGYAPAERFALKEHLGGLGVSVEDMIEAGLLVSGDDIPVPYDRFRDRVMFPITDLRGRVIAFGGRALEKDAQAKYLNSPETPLFHKGGTLFNIAAARAAAHQGAEVIAVEGYVDVIALVSVGYEASVAPLGTALTADQLTLLWKMADEPILCFDGDGAGRRAAYRAVDLALPLLKPGKSLKFASLPDGQDPDDLVRSGGRQAVADVLGAARPLSQMLWMRETEAGGLDTPERRAAFEARLTEVMGLIGDETVRKYYRRDFGERLRNLFEPEGKARPFPREAGRGYSPRSAFPPRSGFQPRSGQGGRRPGPGAGRGFASPGFGSGQPYVVMSQQLAASPLHRGHRAAIPAARGADPAGAGQPSLARARPPGGTRPHRVPPCRYAEIARCCCSTCWRTMARPVRRRCGPRWRRAARPSCSPGSNAVITTHERLGRRADRPPRRTF